MNITCKEILLTFYCCRDSIKPSAAVTRNNFEKLFFVTNLIYSRKCLGQSEFPSTSEFPSGVFGQRESTLIKVD